MSMLHAVIISGMSIVSFIIKHNIIHFSDRNVMLRSVSDRIDGGGEPGRLCVGDRAGSARFVLFSPRKPI